VGWSKEESTFEIVLDTSPPLEIYEAKAKEMYTRVDHGKAKNSPPTSTSQPTVSKNSPHIDLLPGGKVAVDRDYIMELCSKAPLSATKAAVLVMLGRPESQSAPSSNRPNGYNLLS
jgi:hypothetical protein